MRIFLPFKRGTLLIPSGPQDDKERKHLFIILTNPQHSEDADSCILMVSLSTIKQDLPYDKTCILYPGDHPFVKRDSYVSYRNARIEKVDKITKGVTERKLIPHQPLDDAVFVRICNGLEESRFTAKKILAFYHKAEGRTCRLG